ncbi:MAG: hypothetical protein KDC44_14240, partial [Phaeodactylibacter sp.]|nr:hypothetical protein [Phaeodactylibacter sp.]
MKLTLPQQDIYFEQLLYPEDPIYNIGAKIRIEGPLHIPVFQQAYRHLIEQHDTFRTVFRRVGESVEAQVLDTPVEPLEYLDRSAEGEDFVLDFMQREFVKPFDLLGNRFLHRFILIQVEPELHYLFSVYHHIITDGWGTSLMFQRLVSNYNELLEAGAVTTAYPFSYNTFAEDDELYRQSAAYQEDQAFWLEKFSELPENLFEARNRQVDKSNRSARKELYIPR